MSGRQPALQRVSVPAGSEDARGSGGGGRMPAIKGIIETVFGVGSLRWALRRQLPCAASAALMVVLMIVVATRPGNFYSSGGLAAALAEFAPLALATLAISVVALAGEASVDLSIGPLMVLGNVIIVQWLVPAGLTSPVVLILLVVLIGITFHLIMGTVIATLRLQPVIVTLAGYLVLVGLNLVILPQPGGTAPEWLTGWGSPTSVLSAPLYMLIAAFGGWAVISRTTLVRNIKLAGANDRTAYVSGLPLIRARLSAHLIGGLYAGLGAVMLTALLGSGDPTQGPSFTLDALAGLILGGASLAGGRASALGALLGAIDIFMIGFVLGTYSFGAKASYVVEFSTGFVLMIALAGSAGIAIIAELRRRRRQRIGETRNMGAAR